MFCPALPVNFFSRSSLGSVRWSSSTLTRWLSEWCCSALFLWEKGKTTYLFHFFSLVCFTCMINIVSMLYMFDNWNSVFDASPTSSNLITGGFFSTWGTTQCSCWGWLCFWETSLGAFEAYPEFLVWYSRQHWKVKRLPQKIGLCRWYLLQTAIEDIFSTGDRRGSVFPSLCLCLNHCNWAIDLSKVLGLGKRQEL